MAVEMRWQRQKLSFRGRLFEVEHFDVTEAPESSSSSSSGDDDEAAARRVRRQQRRHQESQLERCEAELGACLWLDTNRAALRALEQMMESYAGMRCLELGAGAGAIGIALALDGADSVIADVDALLPLMHRNAAINGLKPPSIAEAVASDSAPVEAEAAATVKGKLRKEKAAVSPAPVFVKANKCQKATGQNQRAARAAAAAALQATGDGKPSDAFAAIGSCVASAAEWTREAKTPTLPAAAFDVIVVCDCLYENKESWDALQEVILRVAAANAFLVLASAMHRKPFLEAFVAQLCPLGCTLSKQEEGGSLGDVVVAILRPPLRKDEEIKTILDDAAEITTVIGDAL